LGKRFRQKVIDHADATAGQQLAVVGQPEWHRQGHEFRQNRFNIGQQDGKFLWHDADAKVLSDQIARHHAIVRHHLELRPGQGKAAGVQPGNQPLHRSKADKGGVQQVVGGLGAAMPVQIAFRGGKVRGRCADQFGNQFGLVKSGVADGDILR
jgi:hypothetical protein